MEKEVRDNLEKLIESVRRTSTYRAYVDARNQVEESPQLKAQIDEFREKNYELQRKYEGDELMEQVERFAEEHAEFRAKPLVDRFLSAELAVCRMVQDMEQMITDSMDFR